MKKITLITTLIITMLSCQKEKTPVTIDQTPLLRGTWYLLGQSVDTVGISQAPANYIPATLNIQQLYTVDSFYYKFNGQIQLETAAKYQIIDNKVIYNTMLGNTYSRSIIKLTENELVFEEKNNFTIDSIAVSTIYYSK